MPQPKAQGCESRIISGPDPERFYCPHPGCNRSFAELWRLKVHYRAPPDVRGSGKERGHGTELKWCPKCGKDLKPGKHHVGCSAGKSAPRQAAKRQRQMSTTTESEWLSSDHSESLEAAVKRQTTRRQATQSEVSTQQQHQHPQHVTAHESCRLERIQHGLDAGELLFTSYARTADFGLLIPAGAIKQEPGAADVTIAARNTAALSPRGAVLPAHHAQVHPAPTEHQQQYAPPPPHPQQQYAGAMPQGTPAAAAAPQDGDCLDWLRAPSPSPFLACPMPSFMEGGEDADALLRVPSPPPLPPDWDPHTRTGMLFDFDQFDPTKRAAAAQQAQRATEQPAVSAPLVTVTSAMTPQEVTNPSDDYIWQILFAGENDPVPKRVTAHLHHPVDFFDDDPILDSLLGSDLAPHGGYRSQQAQQAAVPTQQHPPTLDSIDAVFSGLYPNSLTHMMPHQHHQGGALHQQQAQQSGGSTEVSPGGSAMNHQQQLHPGTDPAMGGEAVQQVPQAQSMNGYTGNAPHALCHSHPSNGKIKQDTSPGNQLPPPPSPPRLHPQQVEVVGGPMDFFGGFL